MHEHRRLPANWKRVRLVLVLKPGKYLNTSSVCRTVCILNEVKKLVATRIRRHFTQDLVNRQYGFRTGRSTMGVIDRLIVAIGRKVLKGDVVLAVYIGIVNAFNTLTWEKFN